MKPLDTILFDLDGTLLAMSQETFTGVYFALLSKRVASMGHDPDSFIKALWKGTMAMIKNDGKMTNRDRFWEVFAGLVDANTPELEKNLEDFYATDFNLVKSALGERPSIRPLLSGLRAKGYGVTLATNPVFPYVAAVSRLGWIGLETADFDYITTYENSSYCKPGLDYYRDILTRLGKEPSQCLMIGNNPDDDMSPSEMGMSVFLLTDYLENSRDLPYDAYPQGGFKEMAEMLEGLPPVRIS